MRVNKQWHSMNDACWGFHPQVTAISDDSNHWEWLMKKYAMGRPHNFSGASWFSPLFKWWFYGCVMQGGQWNQVVCEVYWSRNWVHQNVSLNTTSGTSWSMTKHFVSEDLVETQSWETGNAVAQTGNEYCRLGRFIIIHLYCRHIYSYHKPETHTSPYLSPDFS